MIHPWSAPEPFQDGAWPDPRGVEIQTSPLLPIAPSIRWFPGAVSGAHIDGGSTCRRSFQGSKISPDLYGPELITTLQNELRALADIECIFEEQRNRLERSACRTRSKSTVVAS